jgi:hypothetical protein
MLRKLSLFLISCGEDYMTFHVFLILLVFFLLLAADSRWIVPGSLVDITRVDVSSRGAGARLPS